MQQVRRQRPTDRRAAKLERAAGADEFDREAMAMTVAVKMRATEKSPNGAVMFEPTKHDIAFILDLGRRPSGVRMCTSIKRLKIDRLIDEKYISIQAASMDTKVLTLTPKGWELARKYQRKP
jgi:hypothetical protein